MDRIDGCRQPSRRARTGIVVLLAFFFITPFFVLLLGASGLAPGDVIQVILSHIPGLAIESPSRIAEAIIWDNRAPRVVSGIAIGTILAVSGAALQAVTRNPLAEPYVLGVSSGASSGAAAAAVFVGFAGGLGMSASAFIGAVAATVLVLAIGGRTGQTILHLVLAGIATGFIFHAITNLIVFSSDDPETARSVMFWMLGSLARCTWVNAGILTVTAITMTAAFWFLAPWLDAIATGDNTALTLGIDPARLRIIITLSVSFAVAVTVSAAGGIGFVGLIVPHLCRAFIGSGHRVLIPAAALFGASFLAITDAIARVLFAPAEVPIGVMTGLIGAPVLLWMIQGLGARR